MDLFFTDIIQQIQLTAIKVVCPSGYRQYDGAEQLVLVYNSALTQNFQIDVYAASTSVFNQTLVSVSKL